MTTFQLDQCLDSKRFARDCADEGRCRTLRLPPSLRNAEDPELLTALMTGFNPLVTFDRELPHEHAQFIPASHPGIVIVSNDPSPQTMTVRIAQRVLARFKAALPDWHESIWKNSVVEITSDAIEVWHVEGTRLIPDGYFAFDHTDWPTVLRTLLDRNAQRVA